MYVVGKIRQLLGLTDVVPVEGVPIEDQPVESEPIPSNSRTL